MKKIFCTFALLAGFATMASAQKTLTIGATDNTNTYSTQNWDRIEMVRNVPADAVTLFAVVAPMDGYYFGADAKRWEVQTVTNDNGEHDLKIVPMADDADFEPLHYYIVKPEAGCGAEKLVSITAGIQTRAEYMEFPLNCYTVNSRAVIGSVAKLIDKLNAGSTFTTKNVDDMVELLLHEL